MANQKRVVGRFFFKLTDNGNLIGEFSNNFATEIGPEISTESADFKEPCEDKEWANCKYLGTYHSTWQECGKPKFAELNISPKKGAVKMKGAVKLFTLEWRDNGVLIFEGEGMLCDGILIGDYHGF